MVTFLMPTTRFSRSISRIPSRNKKGYRCGKMFWMSWTSSIIGAPVAAHTCGAPVVPGKPSIISEARRLLAIVCAVSMCGDHDDQIDQRIQPASEIAPATDTSAAANAFHAAQVCGGGVAEPREASG